MQVTCLAPSAQEARQLTSAAKFALDSATGSIAGCEVDWIKADGSRAVHRKPLKGKARPTYGRLFDCEFMFQT